MFIGIKSIFKRAYIHLIKKSADTAPLIFFLLLIVPQLRSETFKKKIWVRFLCKYVLQKMDFSNPTPRLWTLHKYSRRCLAGIEKGFNVVCYFLSRLCYFTYNSGISRSRLKMQSSCESHAQNSDEWPYSRKNTVVIILAHL